jgi:stage II sporulation protein D
MGRLCSYCEKSPHRRWRATLTKKELGMLLEAWNPDRRPLTQLAAVRATASGRITQVRFSTAGGVSGRTVPAIDFRLAVGANQLRSTWFEVADRGTAFEFVGQGWGHGVGLCQYGARAMADARLDGMDILRYYYPNADIVRVY